MPRPKTNNAKNLNLIVRVNQKEREYIKQLADKKGVSISELIRDLLKLSSPE
jgi:predicted DNA binding CopG/RHH family protein